MSRVSRLLSSQLACLAVFASTTAALASEEEQFDALAAPPLATCVGAHRQTYTPGLRLFPATVHFTEDGTLNTCVSQDPTLGSVSYHVDGDAPGSCALVSLGSRLNLTWSTAETSVVEFVSPLVVGPLGQAGARSYGRVVTGKFSGAIVIYVADIQPNTQAPLACLTTGLALSQGVASMTFLQITLPIPPLPIPPNPIPAP